MTRCFRRPLVLAAAAIFCIGTALPASAKSYSADSFDAQIRILDDGTLDVTETVRFRFDDGTFTEVFREIPTRRTDGIEIVRAAIGGVNLPFGTERGTAEVRRRSNSVRVVWRFGPIEHTSRDFILNYRVHGVIRRAGGFDELAWRATPGSHNYRIRTAAIAFVAPASPASTPVVSARKAGTPRVSAAAREVKVTADAIGPNGWIEVRLRFPAGAVIAGPPRWQLRADEIAAGSAMWATIAAAVFLAGVTLLVAWRQGYDRPPAAEHWTASGQPMPPDDLDPATAGVLAANGSARLEHAMAALFSLADRGVVAIREIPRSLGRREFQVQPSGTPPAITGPENALLDIIFGEGAPRAEVSLSQARGRLSRQLRRFSAAVKDDLRASAFLDEGRDSLRRRYQRAAVALLFMGVAGTGALATLTSRYGGWPMLVGAALVALGVVSLIFSASITPLSDEGVRRSRRWRAYRDHLREVSHGTRSGPAGSPTAMLPYAVALGLANAWAKLLKHQPHAAPAWFHAAGDDGGGFPAFVAAGGVGAGGGGVHGGAGGAAGGGASGAH